MEVLKITPRGYCHGVVDAFRIAKRVREETNGPVHMLGMLVHNTHATDGLQEQGIALVDQPDRLVASAKSRKGRSSSPPTAYPPRSSSALSIWA